MILAAPAMALTALVMILPQAYADKDSQTRRSCQALRRSFSCGLMPATQEFRSQNTE